jgi:hypothetical protein
MALITGKDCSLSVGAKVFDDAVNSFEISFDQTEVTYQTLAGPKAGPGSETGTLAITFAYDADETDSLFTTLWAATEAGTPIAYIATVGGNTFTGNAVAVRPSVPAQAGEVSEVSVELPLDGIPTMAPVVP